ncbi:hypothetical protein LZ906_007925 [Paraclostridium ghonii]|uniref:hypothetical protein n=1 Tax=Paraclostridium ghonii TaxID=29358 RepID=UPI00202CAE42|nr:hypothetical protein [Paeniclostridium ghonii]MCM0168168.1 hypothetical protein [Paeniclostridium ghonii]
MGKYFAFRITDGCLDYVEVVRKYPQFKDDLDMWLREMGVHDLIVDMEGLE